MKTAMQELIKKLEQKRDLWKVDGNITERRMRSVYVDAIVLAKERMQQEKEQIIDAYTAGEIHPYNGYKYYYSTFATPTKLEYNVWCFAKAGLLTTKFN